ncbi:MAG: hypothetical protein KIS67_10500 [Verrucomicrobiae bacterium]|nr:hypothetical protein [Verrucomicrobiae bacterium]
MNSARSRILGGIHFQFASEQAAHSGEAIGRFVARNWLLPNETLPRLVMERFSDGRLAIRIHGPPGIAYDLERTTDFRSWALEWSGVGRPGGEAVFVSVEVQGAAFFRLVTPEQD